MKKNAHSWISVLFTALVMAGCGGGGQDEHVAEAISQLDASSGTKNATAQSDGDNYYLSRPITVQVSGAGVVTSSTGSMKCGNGSTVCSIRFAAWTEVVLTATPAANMRFQGWGGACSGTSTRCTLNNTQVRLATATFVSGAAEQPSTAPTISISSPTTASSYATSSASITLAGDAADGTGVTSIYWYNNRGNGGGNAAKTGTTQVKWTAGPLTLQSGQNNLTVTARNAAGLTKVASLVVTYDPASVPVPSTYGLGVSITGTGVVTSVPSGIQCGSDCTEAYVSGTSVALTATPSSGYQFSAWGGACSGSSRTCSVSMTAARSVSAAFVPLVGAQTLTVSVSGSGSVSSAPAGIQCGSDCSESFNSGTSVTLTATPSSGNQFSSWSGACTGTSTNCTVAMSAARNVAAAFVPVGLNHGLTVSVVGSGVVSSVPAGIQCGSDCAESYAAGTTVVLTATTSTGYRFSGWSGACSGSSSVCSVSMSSARTVSATFIGNAGTGVSYFVSPSGSDSNAGNSLSAPFKTLNKAVGVVNAGDVIEVRAGTYVENVVMRRPGSASAWITMRGYQGERPIIKSATSQPTIYFYNSMCDQESVGNGSGNSDCFPMYWVLQGLEIQGSPIGGSDGNAIKIDTPKVRLIGNRLCCSTVDIVKLVRTSNDVEILNNEIWQDPNVVKPSSNAQGVDIVGADRVRVAGNYLHDIPNVAIYAKGNARNPLFESNRLVNIGDANNGHALMLGQSTDAARLVDGTYETYDGIVRNNVVVGSTWACLATSSSMNARFYNNSCYNTGTLAHASVFLSNESEVRQPGTNLYFANNIIYGAAARPVFKMGSNAMTDYKTLYVDHNLYYSAGGSPTFVATDFFSVIGYAQWLVQFKLLTGRDDARSQVADPQFASTSGVNALSLRSQSPAINAGANLTLVPTDILGVKRAQGTASDIGAYEY